MTIYDWILKKVESKSSFFRWGWKRKSATVWVALTILMLAIVLPKTLKPQRYERMTEKWAGIWIKTQSGEGATIFTNIPRVAYYAGGKNIPIELESEGLDHIKASMAEKGAVYLVIGGKDEVKFPEKVEAIKKSFIKSVRYERKGMEEIDVYKRIE